MHGRRIAQRNWRLRRGFRRDSGHLTRLSKFLKKSNYVVWFFRNPVGQIIPISQESLSFLVIGIVRWSCSSWEIIPTSINLYHSAFDKRVSGQCLLNSLGNIYYFAVLSNFFLGRVLCSHSNSRRPKSGLTSCICF